MVDSNSADGSTSGKTSLFGDNNCWKVAKASRFGWLIDGENYFRALRESMGSAEREILIIGWDIDSEVRLVRDEAHPHYPSPLAKTLQTLVDKNESLQVHVLSWDFALVYLLEREMLPAYRFGWEDSERLHFRLDGKHATGASHHQKFVVIDGAVAYIGGFDLTKCRWDSRDHAADDPGRIDTRGTAYRPFHDVQAIVAGEPAAQLRELAAMRWKNATGEQLPEIKVDADEATRECWPPDTKVRGTDVRAALSRTWAAPAADNTVREVERLFIDMISAAQENIYIENQYFTSPTIAAALGERLEEPEGPEIVIVLPAETSGWLEQVSMEMRRNRLLAKLCEQDRHDRLRVVAPESDELQESAINVHGKVIVIDNSLCRIGSANLSCRSMGLDSECDLTIEDDNGDVAPCLRADLIAEHVGADVSDVAKSIEETGLVNTLAAYNEGPRRLRRLQIETGNYDSILEPLAQIADMEQPVESLWGNSAGAAGRGRTSGIVQRIFHFTRSRQARWGFLAVLLLGLAAWATWAVKNLDGEFDILALLAALRESATHPLAPLVAIPAFVAGSLVIAPITGMIAVCALLFSPWVASLTALAGTLVATAVNHRLGHYLGNVVEERAPKALTERMREFGESADAWSLAGLRLIPIAPFSIVNLVAGASRVRLRAFLLGTVIGMGPGIVLICLGVDRARAALSGEPIFDPWIIAGIAATGVALIGFRFWQKKRSSRS